MNEKDKDIELLDPFVETQSNNNTDHIDDFTNSTIQSQNIVNSDTFSTSATVIGSSNNSFSEKIDILDSNTNEFESSNVNLTLQSSQNFDSENNDFHSEKAKKIDLNNSNDLKPTKPIVFFVIFIILLLVIIFLPYIGEIFDSLFPKKENSFSNAGIVSGSLICTLEHESNGISYYYTDTYDFENRKIKNLQHVVSIQGGTDFLNQRNMECQTIKQTVDNFSGIFVECNLSSGEMVETQYFDFLSLKDLDVSTAFIEAGGVYPNVKYGENVSDVKKRLVISGYECRVS